MFLTIHAFPQLPIGYNIMCTVMVVNVTSDQTYAVCCFWIQIKGIVNCCSHFSDMVWQRTR